MRRVTSIPGSSAAFATQTLPNQRRRIPPTAPRSSCSSGRRRTRIRSSLEARNFTPSAATDLHSAWAPLRAVHPTIDDEPSPARCGNRVARQSGDVHVSHCRSRSRGSPAPIALVIWYRRRDLNSGANVRGCLAARRTASVGVGGRAREQHDRTLRERAEVGQLGHSLEHGPFLTGEVRLFAIRRAEQARE